MIARISRGRTAAAAAVGLAFVAIVLANLMVPEPRGPADQGDFTRIFASFSSGPRGLPLWPAPGDPRVEERFFHQYLRHWTYGATSSELARATSSHLLFLPERIRGWIFGRREFDLAANTFFLVVALGFILAGALATLTGVVPFLTLSLAALVVADLRIAWYLNSFFSEAGALFFAFVWLCLSLTWWETRSRALLVASLAALTLLAATKLPYGPSVLPIALAMAALVMPLPSRRFFVVAVATAIGLGTASFLFFADHRAHTEFDNAFHFVFAGALPRLSPEDRTTFLASIGLDPNLAGAAGRNAYDPDGPAANLKVRDPLRGRLHASAAWTLARDHPRAMLGLLEDSLAETGRYDIEGQFGYAWRARDETASPEPPAFRVWSALRSAWIGGWPAYLGLLVGLGVVAVRTVGADAHSWKRFFVALACGCFAGSILQVAIAAIGNGTVDLRKQLFLANLLFDFALVLTAGGAFADRRAAEARATAAS